MEEQICDMHVDRDMVADTFDEVSRFDKMFLMDLRVFLYLMGYMMMDLVCLFVAILGQWLVQTFYLKKGTFQSNLPVKVA